MLNIFEWQDVVEQMNLESKIYTKQVNGFFDRIVGDIYVHDDNNNRIKFDELSKNQKKKYYFKDEN